MRDKFLPVSLRDLEQKGWDCLDIIIVTGDAYVDHPSFGASVIGRILEDGAFRVGIIAQPDCKKLDDFRKLGRPKLFFGVTAGNLDSMLANYTANRKKRNYDDYSPGAKPGLRPDRAIILYTNKIREAFPGAVIVIGGIEASLRRLAHYDYWSDKVRRSILLDSKADILVYGMGERQILEIANRLRRGPAKDALDNIRGTVVITNDIDSIGDHVAIPSFEEVSTDTDAFCDAFRTLYDQSDPVKGRPITQKHGQRFIVQYPSPGPLTTDEMDHIYGLGYTREYHPRYDKDGGVPALETVRFSIISHRGCPGECSFCSLYFHQGRIVQSRSTKSILAEARILADKEEFKGTITDMGGPSANLYGAGCEKWDISGACRDRKCLVPDRCRSLKLGYDKTIRLWNEILKIPKVKHLFIGSGLRYDLLVERGSDNYLKALCAHHVSGTLKVAPEHSDERVLGLMNKPSFATYEKFVQRFDKTNSSQGKKQYLVNYFISAHPGCGLKEALELTLKLAKKGIHPEQIQDYTPLPMTASACMYYTGKNPFTGEQVYVARGSRERKQQRALIQHKQPGNRKYVLEALKKLGRMDLIDKLKTNKRGGGHGYKD